MSLDERDGARPASLTVPVLSCRRLGLLERTLAAARAHFRDAEPAVDVRWVCFDNGSSAEDQRRLAELGFDLLLLSARNLGQGPALNQLLATVRTEHFLLLEDDWVVTNPGARRFVEESLAILAREPRIASVKLDAFYFTDFTDRARYAGPFEAAQGGTRFFVQNPDQLWGGFCFPPSLTRTEAIRRVGPILEDQPFRRWWAESEYSGRFSRSFLVAKSPDLLVFQHAGAAQPCSGWAPSETGVS